MNSRQAARSTTPTKSDSSIEATESAVARAVLPMVLVLMGVSGSGKSTVALAEPRRAGDRPRVPKRRPPRKGRAGWAIMARSRKERTDASAIAAMSASAGRQGEFQNAPKHQPAGDDEV